MFGIENYSGFIIAAVFLNMAPGADTIYILSRSAAFGRKAGFISVAGIMSGCIFHILCAAFGLSLILSSSLLIFSIVKWAGAIYLIGLGIRVLLQKEALINGQTADRQANGLLVIFRQGVLTNVLNPKVSLFFLSFLPQFIDPAAAKGPLPFLLLGATFLATGTLWCSLLALGGTCLTQTLRKKPLVGKLFNKISGMIFIGFGLKLGFDS